MNRKVFISFSGTALLMFFLASCGGDDLTSEASFKIVDKQTGVNSDGNPYVKITVKNIGGKPGYNVTCYVDAKKGNTIVDTGVAYFVNGDVLDPGEQATDEAVFFELSTLNGYELVYELLWLHEE
jgi:hypothetical protein